MNTVKTKINKKCKVCQSFFTSWSCWDRKFCSKPCYHYAQKHFGKYKRQNLHQMLEARKNFSCEQYNKWYSALPKKDKHYLYKENRDNLVKSDKKHLDVRYREWMKSVKNRDNWKCKMSNEDCSGRLEAHHILPWRDYPELRYEINNGISLCIYHHPRGKKKEKEMIPELRKLLITKNKTI